MAGEPSDPMDGLSPWSPAGAMLGDWEPPEGVHLCALCGEPIEDPLEECPTCAAAVGEEDVPSE